MGELTLKIFNLEQELEDYVDKNDEENVSRIIEDIKKLLNRITNKELIYIIENQNILSIFIDLFSYFKKYRINKKEIKMNKSYKEEFQKLRSFLEIISDICINEDDYMYVCRLCEIDNTSEYLLSNMSNEEIYDLSKTTDDWNYKLFFFDKFRFKN